MQTTHRVRRAQHPAPVGVQLCGPGGEPVQNLAGGEGVLRTGQHVGLEAVSAAGLRADANDDLHLAEDPRRERRAEDLRVAEHIGAYPGFGPRGWLAVSARTQLGAITGNQLSQGHCRGEGFCWAEVLGLQRQWGAGGDAQAAPCECVEILGGRVGDHRGDAGQQCGVAAGALPPAGGLCGHPRSQVGDGHGGAVGPGGGGHDLHVTGGRDNIRSVLYDGDRLWGNGIRLG